MDVLLTPTLNIEWQQDELYLIDDDNEIFGELYFIDDETFGELYLIDDDVPTYPDDQLYLDASPLISVDLTESSDTGRPIVVTLTDLEYDDLYASDSSG